MALQRELMLKIASDIAGATHAEKALDRLSARAKNFAEQQLHLAQGSGKFNAEMMHLSKNTETALRAMDRFNPRISRMAYGMTSLVSKINAVNSSIAALGATYMGQKAQMIYRQGMSFNENMESSVARMSSEIRREKESLDSAMSRSREQIKWVQQYRRGDGRIYSQDELQHTLADFAVLYRGDINKAQRATRTAALLAAKNPHQGLEGAKIAIQEAESGVWTSPSRRFFLPKATLEQYKDQGGLGAIEATLKDIKVTPELLQRMGNTMHGMKGQINGTYQQMFGQMTKGLFDARREHMMFVREQLEGLTSEKGAFTKIGGVISELGGKLGKIYYNALEFPMKNADKILKFLNNLKKALDPMMAVLKSFGKGLYQGFIGPINMLIGQMKFMTGTGGRMASILSKLVGAGGKAATSPLYMLAPLAGMAGRAMGAKWGMGLTGKAWQYASFGGLRQGIKGGSGYLKDLWGRMGEPMFGGNPLAAAVMGNAGAVMGHSYRTTGASAAHNPAVEALSDILNNEHGAGGQLGRAAEILSTLNHLQGMASPAGFLTNMAMGGMGDGGMSGMIENLIINKLGFVDDLSQTLGNLSNAASELMQGMGGILSPMNALSAAVTMTIAPFTLLAKILKVVTAPLNSKVGTMAMHGIGKVAAPLLWPAMFAMGGAGTMNVFRQLSGMATEGVGAFGKGWTGRVGRAFLHGTDFELGGAGQRGVGIFNQRLGQVLGGARTLTSRLPGWAQNPINGLLNIMGSGHGGVAAGVSTFSSTADFLLGRLPGRWRNMAMSGAHNGINSMLGAHGSRIEGLRAQLGHLRASGAPAHQIRTLEQEITFAEHGLHAARGYISQNGMPTSLAGANQMRGALGKMLGHRPVQENLQDTLERLLTQTPTWFNTLPVWFTHFPTWMGGGYAGGGHGGSPTGGWPGGGGPRGTGPVGGSSGGLGSGVRGALGNGIKTIDAPGAPGTPLHGAAEDVRKALGLPPGTPLDPDSVKQGLKDKLIHKVTGMSKEAAERAGLLDADGKIKHGNINTANLKAFGGNLLAGGKKLGRAGVTRAGTIFNPITGTLGGIGSVGKGIGKVAASAFPEMLPLLLGGTAIATIVTLTKHVMGRIGGLGGIGAAFSGMGGRISTGFQNTGLGIRSGMNTLARFAPMAYSAGGLAIGGALMNGLMTKGVAGGFRALSLPGKALVVGGTALAGLLGYKIGGAKSQQMRDYFQFDPRKTKGLDWVTGGSVLPAAIGMALLGSSKLMRNGFGRTATGFAGNILSGRWMTNLAGAGLRGASRFVGETTRSGKVLGFLGNLGWGSIFKGGGSKAVGGLEKLLISGTRTKGILGPLSQLAYIGFSLSRDAIAARAPKGIQSRMLGALAQLPGFGKITENLAKNELDRVAPLTFGQKFSNFVGKIPTTASSLYRFGGRVVKGGANSLLNIGRWAIGQKGLRGDLSGLSGFARRTRIGSRVGLLGLAALAISNMAGGSSATSLLNRHADAQGNTAEAAGADGPSWSTALGILPFLTPALVGSKAFKMLRAASMGGSKIARLASKGLGFLGVSGEGALKLGSKFAMKRGLAAIPMIGEMYAAGQTGWDVGRWMGKSHMFGAKKTTDQTIQDFFYKHLFGGKDDLQQTQANTMVSKMKSSSAQAQNKVKEASESVTGGIMSSLSGMWTNAQNWLYKITGGRLGTAPGSSSGAAPAAGGAVTPPATPSTKITAAAAAVASGGGITSKAGAKGIDQLIYGIGKAEGWGVAPDGKGGWKMAVHNSKTTAPFGMLGDFKKYPQLGKDANLLHDFMLGKMTGQVTSRVAALGIHGFGATVVPGLIDGKGNVSGGGLSALQKIWAPIGAKNDPHHLNDNWLGNVTRLSATMPLPAVTAIKTGAAAPGSPSAAGNHSISVGVNVHAGATPEQISEHVGKVTAQHVLKTLRSNDGKKALAGKF